MLARRESGRHTCPIAVQVGCSDGSRAQIYRRLGKCSVYLWIARALCLCKSSVSTVSLRAISSRSLSVYRSSAFTSRAAVSLMVAPIVSSVLRKAFSQALPGSHEASCALGVARSPTSRTIVPPPSHGDATTE